MPADQTFDPSKFNSELALPYSLRLDTFASAMQDVYDFFSDVNALLLDRGLPRLDDMLRPAAMSGILSDMITASVAKQSRVLVENTFHNGHPDLVVQGRYQNNGVAAGEHGIEIKSTRNRGGQVDTHGGRNQWMCVFVYVVDSETEPAAARRPMKFTEVYLAEVEEADFRRNLRGDRGTPTSSLHRQGLAKLRRGWLYRDP